MPFEIESIGQVRHRKFGKLALPLPTPENLIIMKSVAHRPKDMEDISALVETQPNLDVGRIRQCLKEFAGLLEIPEIFSDVDKLLVRAAGKKTRRQSKRKK